MEEKQKIIKVKKNAEGDIVKVMLNDNSIYSLNEAINFTKNELLEGVNVGKSKNGREFLRSNPNGKKDDNLDNLPLF